MTDTRTAHPPTPGGKPGVDLKGDNPAGAAQERHTDGAAQERQPVASEQSSSSAASGVAAVRDPSEGDHTPDGGSSRETLPEDDAPLDTPAVAGVEQDELTATAAQRDEYLALAKRTQADFENYRKRIARESASAQDRGVAKLARELLPALDNLDRALEAAAEQDPLLEGVRLVRSELVAALGRVGIDSFSPVGEPFDPALHEAIVQQPAPECESGTVVEVYQPGYRLHGTIIRPARVVVAA
jgi:molecular chaperone GrpE